MLAWYAKNPQMFIWGNPEWDFPSVADIGEVGRAGAGVRGRRLPRRVPGKGLLDTEQIDTSYQGDPSRFVAADGKIVSQGFVTAEPYIYEHEVNAWKQPVEFLLLDEAFPVYQNTMAVRADRSRATARACRSSCRCCSRLDRLRREPELINDVLVDFASQIGAAGSRSGRQGPPTR